MVHVYGLRCLLLYHESQLNKLFVFTRRFVANATSYGGMEVPYWVHRCSKMMNTVVSRTLICLHTCIRVYALREPSSTAD